MSSTPTSTVAASNQTNAGGVCDLLEKFEHSVYNKTHMDTIKMMINLMERKRINYTINVIPFHGDDKKTIKRTKKIINNNKYILFNSWYTKNRKEQWPNSHVMWNYMKKYPSAKAFVEVFDLMEKLGKSIDVKQTSNEDNGADKRRKNDAVAIEDIKENNGRRIKLYNEFYRVLTVTYESGHAPAVSFLYDYKLNSADAGSIDRLNRNAIQHCIDSFKTVLNKVEQGVNTNNVSATPASGSRKRKITTASTKKNVGNVAIKVKKLEEASGVDSKNYSMVNDYIEDSQMSE